MSGASSRRKGKAGELEFCNLLSDWLGIPLARNLEQPRGGGRDVALPFPVSLEIKRTEHLAITRWLAQARRQADPGEIPAVAYRRSREPWRVVVEMSTAEFSDYLRSTFEMPAVNRDAGTNP